jgi:hypothetical protein
VELAAALGTAKSGSLIVAAIASVFTIGYVANLLREDEDWLHELSIDMFPEDGRLWVYGVGGAKMLLSGSLSSPFPRPREQLTARRARGDRERWFRANDLGSFWKPQFPRGAVLSAPIMISSGRFLNEPLRCMSVTVPSSRAP